MTSAILLASGFSRRMGRDKLMLDYKNKPLAAYAIDAIARACVDERIIVTNNPRLAALASGFMHVLNPRSHEGVSAAVRAGVLAAHADRYIFFVADQPLITAALIDCMIALAGQNPDKIITAAAGGRRGNPALFPNTYRESLLRLNGDMGGREIIAQNPEQVLAYEAAAALLSDIDIAADYDILLRSEPIQQ